MSKGMKPKKRPKKPNPGRFDPVAIGLLTKEQFEMLAKAFCPVRTSSGEAACICGETNARNCPVHQ